MDLSFNTTLRLDATLAISAHNLYKEGRFREAITPLQDVLDYEPQNGYARLLLGVCFFKTGNAYAAERAFNAVKLNTRDQELRDKAIRALDALNFHLNMPRPEYGCVVERVYRPAPFEAFI